MLGDIRRERVGREGRMEGRRGEGGREGRRDGRVEGGKREGEERDMAMNM